MICTGLVFELPPAQTSLICAMALHAPQAAVQVNQKFEHEIHGSLQFLLLHRTPAVTASTCDTSTAAGGKTPVVCYSTCQHASGAYCWVGTALGLLQSTQRGHVSLEGFSWTSGWVTLCLRRRSQEQRVLACFISSGQRQRVLIHLFAQLLLYVAFALLERRSETGGAAVPARPPSSLWLLAGAPAFRESFLLNAVLFLRNTRAGF